MKYEDKFEIITYVIIIISMRKIILFIASNLDRYITKNNGNVGWLQVTTSSGYW
ncbi:MAG: hypothetical protein OEL56_01650 [Nitrosopumilus sp.]|nr:hypothetical protein [Nitrosopumilus sp.]MDH3515183.1 hypothetical protein [Nitrosopumilus sp.]MDH3564516.1 hypothetical protein [Nitrosopumilus sp.]MDH5554276.1 hypothetical protein [Nitrosopumilus sp.]